MALTERVHSDGAIPPGRKYFLLMCNRWWDLIHWSVYTPLLQCDKLTWQFNCHAQLSGGGQFVARHPGSSECIQDLLCNHENDWVIVACWWMLYLVYKAEHGTKMQTVMQKLDVLWCLWSCGQEREMWMWMGKIWEVMQGCYKSGDDVPSCI